MARVYVSYASEDRELARRLLGWLQAEGHQVFLDEDVLAGISVGEGWQQRLFERLRWADAVVCIVTSAYVASTWCAAEVGIASSQGSKLLPVLAEDGVLHPLLTSVQHADHAENPARARTVLHEALRRVDASGGHGWDDSHSPFPGLRPFEAAQQAVFCGRRRETQELLKLIRAPTEQSFSGILLVIGPSGCGKSSLLRAGLLPQMAGESDWWALSAFRPGNDPTTALARELAAAGRHLGLDTSLSRVRRRLEEEGLAALADDLLVAAPGGWGGRRRRLLVPVDQLEELLTLTDSSARAHFAGLLAAAVGGPVSVVATLRPEFMAQLLDNPELTAIPMRPHPLRPLERDALASVITEPARLAGIEVPPELLARLVSDTGSGTALPLLAFALEQLSAGVGRGGCLSLERYEELGGVQGALVRQADAALNDAVSASGRSPDRVVAGLLRLVAVDDLGRPTRTSVPADELPATIRTEMEAFVTRRLLTTDTQQGHHVIAVAHDSFVSAWRPLSEASRQTAVALRMRQRVESAALEWDVAGRPNARLWERGRLAGALSDLGARVRRRTREEVSATSGPTGQAVTASRWRARGRRTVLSDRVDLSPRAGSFLQQSLRVDRLRRARTSIVLASLLALALAATVVAVAQQRAAEDRQREADDRQRAAVAGSLVARSEAVREDDPRTALLLGLAAQRIHPDSETRASLVRTLTGTRYTGTLSNKGATGAVRSVAFAPGDRILAVGGTSHRVALWDVVTKKRVGHLLDIGTGIARSLSFSSDGHTLAAGGSDGTVHLWDVTDPAHPAVVLRKRVHQDTVYAVTFATDARSGILATAGRGEVVIWRTSGRGRPGSYLPIPTSEGTRWTSLAFSREGRTLAAGGADGTMLLWDLSDPLRPDLKQAWEAGSGGVVSALVLSPDGRFLSAGGEDGTVRLWDVSDQAATPVLQGQPVAGHVEQVYSLRYAQGGDVLLSGGVDGRIITWDVARPGGPVQVGRPMTGHNNGVSSLDVSSDGLTLASGSWDGTVILWDLSATARPTRAMTRVVDDHGVESLTFAPRRGVLATGSSAGTVRLWRMTATKELVSLQVAPPAHSGRVNSVAFDPDGDRLISAGDDGRAILWDVSDPAHMKVLRQWGHDGPVTSAAFAGDGRTIATSQAVGDVTVRAVRGRRWMSVLDLPPSQEAVLHTSVAFDPGGRQILAQDNFPLETVILWAVRSHAKPKVVDTLPSPHGSRTTSLAMSGGRRRFLAAGDSKGAVSLWDVSDARGSERSHLLQGHAGEVTSVAFDARGRTLVSGGADHAVQLWDLSDGNDPGPLGEPLFDHMGAVTGAAFAPDGQTLATSSARGTVSLWDVAALNAVRNDPTVQACRMTDGGLDPAQWRQEVPSLPWRDSCRG